MKIFRGKWKLKYDRKIRSLPGKERLRRRRAIGDSFLGGRFICETISAPDFSTDLYATKEETHRVKP